MEVMARYGASADVAWKMGRIMLKYRPIAPKPVNGGGAVSTAVDEAKSSSKRGTKRRITRVNGSKYYKKTKENKNKNKNNNNNTIVTLPLMPVTPERKDESPSTPTPSPTASDGYVAYFHRPVAQVVAPRPVRPVGSWVTVECVTDTWPYGEGAGGSFAALEEDTCPVFVSDAGERVTWTNAAYRRMVVGPVEEEEEELRVALVSRGLVPEAGVTCFTCRVRVRYACRRRGKVTTAVPCDAWRVGDGRIVWRLDVKAALSLSTSLVC